MQRQAVVVVPGDKDRDKVARVAGGTKRSGNGCCGVNPSIVVPEDTVAETCGERQLPRMGIIEQVWNTDPIPADGIAAKASEQVQRLDFADVPQGGSVAIGVGSRGIANLPTIVRGVVDGVRDLGFEPFVFPAMGSHAGATAEGQAGMLAKMGVNEKKIGCEIRSSMEVERLGKTEKRGVPVVADAQAAAADAIVPVNRVKPHTDFDGPIESGLSKMITIGMGKQRGAKIAHEWAVDWSLREMIPELTERLLEELPILGGVAIVEDERDETAIIEGVAPDELLERERELLKVAYERMPKLPFDKIDVLIVDSMGKDVSGQGMDTNVIGRRPFAINEPEPDLPEVKRLYVRSLTDTTEGNAMGMGSADFAHRRVLEELDGPKSLINAITACTVRGVRLPPVVATDKAGLLAALSTIGVEGTDPESVQVLRVTDTMRLKRMYASESLIEESRRREDLRVIGEPEEILFEDGDFEAPPPE